jgi:hypothetical protein
MQFKWSYSALSSFQQCPQKFYRQYIAKDVERVTSKAAEAGTAAHTDLEKRLAEGVALPAHLAHVEPVCQQLLGSAGVCHAELSLGVTDAWEPCGFFDPKAWGRCRCDVVLAGGGNALLIDWKTGKPSNAKYQTDFELRVQASLVKAYRPETKTIFGLYYWVKAGTFSSEYDVSDVTPTRQEITALYHKIVTTPEVKFKTKKSPLCSYCPVTTCKHWKPLPEGA